MQLWIKFYNKAGEEERKPIDVDQGDTVHDVIELFKRSCRALLVDCDYMLKRNDVSAQGSKWDSIDCAALDEADRRLPNPRERAAADGGVHGPLVRKQGACAERAAWPTG